MELLDFKPGMRVSYVGPRVEMRGFEGKVIRPVKSRKVVCVDFDRSHAWFDANPQSLEECA